MGEFVDAVKESPSLLAFVVIVTGVVFAAEKLAGVNGPVTRAWSAWHDRELNRLKREALVRAERRRIELDEDNETIAALRADVAWLTDERDDQRRRDRVRDQHDRELAHYVWRLLQSARAAGVHIDEPPRPPDLAPMFVQGDELDDPPTAPLRRSRNPARALPPPG